MSIVDVLNLGVSICPGEPQGHNNNVHILFYEAN